MTNKIEVVESEPYYSETDTVKFASVGDLYSFTDNRAGDYRVVSRSFISLSEDYLDWCLEVTIQNAENRQLSIRSPVDKAANLYNYARPGDTFGTNNKFQDKQYRQLAQPTQYACIIWIPWIDRGMVETKEQLPISETPKIEEQTLSEISETETIKHATLGTSYYLHQPDLNSLDYRVTAKEMILRGVHSFSCKVTLEAHNLPTIELETPAGPSYEFLPCALKGDFISSALGKLKVIEKRFTQRSENPNLFFISPAVSSV